MKKLSKKVWKTKKNIRENHKFYKKFLVKKMVKNFCILSFKY